MTAKYLFLLALLALPTCLHAGNPIITDKFTADPAALVVGDTVYLYVGQDEATERDVRHIMNRWLCYSTQDMKTWKFEGSPLATKDFSWVRGDAWAGQVIGRDGRYFYYVPMEHATVHGKSIGVAVADSPTGPFKDALGHALVTNDMTKATGISWDDIDPTVFIDDDGQAWLFWGNTKCYRAKLKRNMIEFDGDIEVVDLQGFEEAPWLHKHDGTYHLSYATGSPEKIAYSTALSINGPWTYRGLLAEMAGNSDTIHQAIIEFKGQSYFIYHNGSIQRPHQGGSLRRSVCVDYLYYNADGTMKRVVQTTEGTDLPPTR